jgi:hypothetical protein
MKEHFPNGSNGKGKYKKMGGGGGELFFLFVGLKKDKKPKQIKLR